MEVLSECDLAGPWVVTRIASADAGSSMPCQYDTLHVADHPRIGAACDMRDSGTSLGISRGRCNVILDVDHGETRYRWRTVLGMADGRNRPWLSRYDGGSGARRYAGLTS